MKDVTVIIPNYNGIRFLTTALESLRKQDTDSFEIVVVDNGSDDGSTALLREQFPEVRLVSLPENVGFAAAVNCGIRQARSPYVLLLNNDTEAEPSFVRELLEAIRRHRRAFSCQAMMMNFEERELLDGAGDLYNAMGWAFARGKGKDYRGYDHEERIFSSCAGAAIYRRKLVEKLGLFDEEHFAYLEDMDLCYRARLMGFENWYIPRAVVYHMGSATTGSRYNQFKIRYSSRNNVYMIYKNMPLFQILLNLPLLIAGFGIKILFFAAKGYGREYLAGIKNGFTISRKERKVPFSVKRLRYYVDIQMELWENLFKRF